MLRVARKLLAWTSTVLGAVILTFALAGAGMASAASLAQAGTGTITGQVLSLDNVALPNVRLATYSQAPGTPNRTPLSRFQSDAQGNYSVQVPAGQIWVEFETQDINGQSFWGYDLLPLDVASGSTITGQDFRVAIRIVSEPAAPVTQPQPVATATAPGMPTTGVGFTPVPVLVAMFGLLLMTAGLVMRRKSAR